MHTRRSYFTVHYRRIMPRTIEGIEMTFSELNLSPALLRAVAACGYETPTPIQAKAITPAIEGRDVMGLAQTGTGKTAAFVLPILQKLSQGPVRRIRALVIAPTRELAEQTHDAFGALGKYTKVRSVTIYGGVGMGPQIRKIREGAEVVVACPGRLLDLMSQGVINLANVEVLVLDEADRMFDMGFLPDVKRIMSKIPAKRQTLFFSATMPADIRKLADEILHEPEVVKIGHTAPAHTVSHALYPVKQHLKTPLLVEILNRTDKESVLVFTRTKHRAKKVAEHLGKVGYKATSLQGNLSQNMRQAALNGFKSGTYQVLVATDIAARGIDVSSISHVINYDMPDTADSYTHRIGRTGRAAKTGDAYTLVTHEDTAMVYAIERLLGSRPEMCTLEGFDYKQAAPAGTSMESDRPSRGGYGRGGYGRGDNAGRSGAGSGRPSASRSGAPSSAPRRSARPEQRADNSGRRSDRQYRGN